MRAPRRLGPYKERASDCNDVMEEAIRHAADQAGALGWTRHEIWASLSVLAANIMRTDIESEITDQMIERAIRERLTEGPA